MKKAIILFAVILLQFSFANCQNSHNDFPVLKGLYLGQIPPGSAPKVFAPGIVSTDMINHSSISISPDGNEIYWAMSPLDTPSRIYFSRMVNGVWSEPEIAAFTKTEDGDCPVISPDGRKMFFNSDRVNAQGNRRRERIWCTERIQEGWNEPFCLSGEINDEHLHWQVSVDNQGNLYFGSERTGTKGRDDVFFAGLINGSYRKPVSMENEINSDAHEGCPYIAPDGRYLIFSRNGGLWISFKGNDGRWVKAVSMGREFEGVCPYVSPDGKYIFFLKMGMRNDDVYWASAQIIGKLRPGE
jgi:Tol biopolymer transport system component